MTSAARRVLGTALITVAAISCVACCIVTAIYLIIVAFMLFMTLVGSSAPAPTWSSYVTAALWACGVLLSLLFVGVGRRIRRGSHTQPAKET
jgi:TRAP-type C4-dicarboxylate transport system permease small subunit